MKKLYIICGLSVSCLTVPVLASVQFNNVLGSNGIDVLKLHQPPYNLTGRKIAIGQVEIGRPGMFGLDKAVSKNRAISPVAVFSGTEPAKSTTGVDPHAYNVAAVMISQDKAWTGVAPGARLYSSAVGSTRNMGQPEECLAAQHIALQNGGDVRAINFSFGEPLHRDPREKPVLDGQALLTLCIDWSSRVHNVVYAIAGNQGKGGIPIPTDNFNGINVAFSSPREGIFNKIHVSNLAGNNQGVGDRLAGKEFNIGGRRSISIVAPGTNIPVLNPDGKLNKATGSSFAAPHITATIALLQEFADRQLRIKQPNWTINARNHLVMKSVLLNSAEKVIDNGNGLWLGMKKNLVDKQNRNWFDSDAYKSPQIPLDQQMGAGHLNAYRAYKQFMFGQWQPNTNIPPIGWDYNQINANSALEYNLDKPLQKNSFVAITLTWDRLVKLNDKNKNQQYDLDESFQDQGLNNLDLYLIKADGIKTETATCASVSKIDNVEHIFCPVPDNGKYKIRVQFQQQVNEPTQPFALAWWTVPGN
ncbi:MAG: peptidase S8 and S53 subtilisin kexin sedolisin [Nostocales cyanobacterium]|nr:MAG: peptidase S8 and S53 subtilisin kexin sedolisin [Nostocales cyanobacterium]